MRTACLLSALLLTSSGCAGSLALSAHATGGATLQAGPGGASARASTGGPPLRASVDARVDFFGIPLDGAQDVVFVLDRSGSMSLVSTGFSGRDVGMDGVGSTLASIGGTVANGAAGGPLPSKMEAAKQELVSTLNAMPDGTRVGVIFFDDQIATFSQRMFVLGPQSRRSAEQFIRGIEPGGSTAAVPALRLAYAMGARRVVLLSDGLANDGGDGDDLLREARAQIGRGLRFDTVGVGLDQDADLLRTLARDSGGTAVMR